MYQDSDLSPESHSQNFLRFIAAHSLWAAHNRSHSISVINSSRKVRSLAGCGRTASRRSSVRPPRPPARCRCRQPIALASLLRVHRLEGRGNLLAGFTHSCFYIATVIHSAKDVGWGGCKSCSRLDCGRARVAAQRHFVIAVQFAHRKLGTLRSGPELIMRYRLGL